MTTNDAEYMARYRAENPGYVEAQRLRGIARNRATAWLRKRYREEFEEKYTEELRNLTEN